MRLFAISKRQKVYFKNAKKVGNAAVIFDLCSFSLWLVYMVLLFSMRKTIVSIIGAIKTRMVNKYIEVPLGKKDQNKSTGREEINEKKE